MKPRELAALIRKGALMRPQCSGEFFRGGASCSIGAAYEGLTGKTCGGVDGKSIRALLPELFESEQIFSELGRKIYAMNDSGKTREQIADWLDTLEPENMETEFREFMQRATNGALEIAPRVSTYRLQTHD